MREIIAEFDVAFAITKRKAPLANSANEETAAGFRKTFYTQSGWAGSRYTPNLSLRNIAPIIRGYVKDVYPTYKFSIQTEYFFGGRELKVALMEAPESIFLDERIKATAIERRRCGTGNYYKSDEEAIQHCLKESVEGRLQTWKWYYDWMIDKAKAVLQDVEALVNSYNYDDSDSQIDYFNCNFYTVFDIGKWDRPLKIVQRQERIQSGKVSKDAKRLSA